MSFINLRDANSNVIQQKTRLDGTEHVVTHDLEQDNSKDYGSGNIDSKTQRTVEAVDSELTVAAKEIQSSMGAKDDAPASSDTGTFSVIAFIKRLQSKIPTIGRKTTADSVSVTLSSDHANVPTEEKGELLEATEALRMAINTLTKTIGFAMPDTAGRLRVLAENPTAGNLQVTAVIAAAQTLATLTTLSNQTSMGGFAANDQIPALMNTLAVQSRRNISVT